MNWEQVGVASLEAGGGSRAREDLESMFRLVLLSLIRTRGLDVQADISDG